MMCRVFCQNCDRYICDDDCTPYQDEQGNCPQKDIFIENDCCYGKEKLPYSDDYFMVNPDL